MHRPESSVPEPESRPEVPSSMDDVPAGLAVLDRTGRFTYVNRAFAAISGIPAADHLGRPAGEVLAGFAELAARARTAMETGTPAERFEIDSRAATGSSTGSAIARHYQIDLQPLMTAGNAAGVLIVATDRTAAARMRAQAQLQADRERVLAKFLASAAQASSDEQQILALLATHAAELGGGACAIFLVSPDGERAEIAAYHDIDAGRLAEGRPIAARSFPLADTSVGAVIGTGKSLLVPAVAESELSFGTPELDAFRQRFPLFGLLCTPLSAGTKVIGAVTVYRYEGARAAFDEADVRFFETLADGAAVILDLSRTHRALADTARRMASIVDGSPLATILVDRDFRVRLWNRAAEEMFGWTEAEVLGESISIAPPDLEGEIAELRASILAGSGIAGLETRRLRRDGTEIGVALYEAPLRDSDGVVVGAVLLLANTLERKRLEAELVQSRKMETVGRLAGGIAHDFNNILTVLTGYASLLAAEADDPDAVRADSELIGEVAKRASGLTRQLLSFSRRQEANVSVLDANEIVMTMQPLVARLVGESVEVVVVVERDAVRLEADAAQLEQVVLNLAANARDAMPEGGRLVIQTGVAHFDRTSLSRHFEMPAGDYSTISMTDTGTGMDEQTRAHLFEPFFTTKPAGKGTGLGLATSYNIVKQAQGYISVYSEPGHGSTFRIYFPAVDAPVRKASARPAQARQRSGRLLLVEGEDELRSLALRVLADTGFDVLVAPNPAEALDLDRQNRLDGIDLLVTDVIMPGMTGPELAGRLRDARPDLAVLLMSGHTEEIVAATNTAGSGFLAKAFTPDELLEAIDTVLARKGARSGLDSGSEQG